MVKRGEIYWVDLPPGVGSEQTGHRPGLIIQNDRGNTSSPTTIVANITSQPRRQRYPFHVPFTARESGLPLDSTVLCEQVVTVDLKRVEGFLGALGREKMREVDAALHWSLGLEH